MFIAFDGMDGTGKSTQIERIREYLSNSGKNIIKIDFGGMSYFNKYIKKINDKEIIIPSEIRELIYYFEGMYTNINVIQKHKDDIVLIDRYYLSYYAYGLENGMSEDEIKFFTSNLIEPDLYFFLDCDAETTCSRIQKYRNFDAPELGYNYENTEADDQTVKKHFIDFQKKIRNNYLNHLSTNHILIDASKPMEAVTGIIINEIRKLD